MHELGHAVTAKLLLGDPLEIIIGSYNPQASTLIKIGCFNVKGVSPFFAAVISQEAILHHPYLAGISLAAGPLVGYGTACALSKIYSKIWPQSIIPKKISKFAGIENLLNLVPFFLFKRFHNKIEIIALSDGFQLGALTLGLNPITLMILSPLIAALLIKLGIKGYQLIENYKPQNQKDVNSGEAAEQSQEKELALKEEAIVA